MILTVNNKSESIPEDSISVAELLSRKNVKESGTAVAVNGMLCLKEKWPVKMLRDGDDVMIITAAYGG